MFEAKSAEARILKLEHALAHLQLDYDKLNEVLTEQALTNHRLEKTVSVLLNRLQALESRTREVQPRSLEEERPPHY